MNPYIQKLNIYLADNPPDYGCHDAHSLLEMLYFFYTEFNPIDNSAIKQHFRSLGQFFHHLTIEESDQVFNTVSDLLMENERLAFISGIHVGIRLESELNSK